MADATQVTFVLDLAEALPSALDPNRSTVAIGFMLDMPDGATPDYVIKVRSQDRWLPTFFGLDPKHLVFGDPLQGSAEIDGSRLTVRVDRTAIGDPATFRLNAAVAFEDYPPEDPVHGLSSLDGVPETPEEAIEVVLD